MKRVITAVVLLIFLVFIGIYENVYINDFCDKKQSEIELCRKLYEEDPNECIKHSNEFKTEWDKYQNRMLIFVNHSVVDDISLESERLSSYSEKGNVVEYNATCNVIHHLLQVLKDDQRITIDKFY